MKNLQALYHDIKKKATHIITEFSENLVYHDIKFATRFEGYIEKINNHTELPEDEVLLSKIAAWIVSASFDKVKHKIDKEGNYTNNLSLVSGKLADKLIPAEGLSSEHHKKIKEGIADLAYPILPKTIIGMLLVDGIASDIIMEHGKKRLKKFYEELLLNDVTISRNKWYDVAINIAQNYQLHLAFCKTEFDPLADKLALELQKEKKHLDKSKDLALKKELNISDAELKALKKNISEVGGRDARGIQTVFRTMSKNHYTLNEMVDKKASIMITVNSIILSLVLGGIFKNNMPADVTNEMAHSVPVLLLTLGSVGSIIFAILSTRPDSTHGHFTEEQIRNKKGNLLFYGNFHEMKERDYQWAFLQMLNDQEYMYESMIRDIYYLGKILKKKYFHIRISLTIFIVGIVFSVCSRLVTDFLGYWIWA